MSVKVFVFAHNNNTDECQSGPQIILGSLIGLLLLWIISETNF